MRDLDIGSRIRKMREARMWSQAQLAREADVAPSTVLRYESGQNYLLSVPTLVKIADALDVSLDYLTGRT